MAQGSPNNAAINVTTDQASPVTVVGAKTGYAIRVMGYVLTAARFGEAWPDGGVASVQWADDSTTPVSPLSGEMPIRPSLPLVVPVVPQTETDPGGYFQTASGANLLLAVGGAPVTGHVTYCYVAQ